MTAYNNLTMLSDVEFGQASGNYDGSSQLFYSNAVPAANYYGGNGSIQTIYYDLSGLVGVITIEATLNDLPDQAQWFEISERGDEVLPETGLTTATVTGNFSWIRARVSGFDAGTIISVRVAY